MYLTLGFVLSGRANGLLRFSFCVGAFSNTPSESSFSTGIAIRYLSPFSTDLNSLFASFSKNAEYVISLVVVCGPVINTDETKTITSIARIMYIPVD